MSLKIQNSRQLLKRTSTTGATPTCFTGATPHTESGWTINDIYPGEFYLNMSDRRLWYGWEDDNGNRGVQEIVGFTGGSASCITDLYVTNIYGCSPINIWDNLIMQTGTTIQSPDGWMTLDLDTTGVGIGSFKYDNGTQQTEIQIGANTLNFFVNNTPAFEDMAWVMNSSDWGVSFTQSDTQILVNGTNTNPSIPSVNWQSEGIIELKGTTNSNPQFVILEDGQVKIQDYLFVDDSIRTFNLTADTITATTYQNLPFELQFACSDETTAITTGTTKITLRSPCAFTLTEVRGSLSTAQTTGNTFTVDVNLNGSSVLSTLLTIDNGEKTSVTAATPPVISTTSIPDDGEITIDVDQIGDGTAKGLKILLKGKRDS